MSDWTVHVFDARERELLVMGATCVWPADRRAHAYELRYLNGKVRETGHAQRAVVRFRGHNIWATAHSDWGALLRGVQLVLEQPWLLDHEGMIQCHSAFTDGDDTEIIFSASPVESFSPVENLEPVAEEDPARDILEILDSLGTEEDWPMLQVLGTSTFFHERYPAAHQVVAGPFEARFILKDDEPPYGELRCHNMLLFEGTRKTPEEVADAINQCADEWLRRTGAVD